MKKTGIFFSILFFLFYYERYEVIDVRNYQSAVKSVEVKGEVQHPGVYQLERHANVEKAIKASGGLTKPSRYQWFKSDYGYRTSRCSCSTLKT